MLAGIVWRLLALVLTLSFRENSDLADFKAFEGVTLLAFLGLFLAVLTPIFDNDCLEERLVWFLELSA